MHRKSIVLLTILLAIQSFVLVVHASSVGEIDAVAFVTNIHDGDTFYINRSIYGSNTIRMADINASELGQPNSTEALNLLASLINQTTVYLDIDDNYTFDYHGTGDRLVCVVYVEYNATHYLNVNKKLVDSQLAETKDYTDNEFDPSTWTLYVPKEAIPEFPSFLILPFFMIIALFAAGTVRRKKSE